MAIIKCKMCGGDLPLTEGMTVCECEYCGTRQTIPRFDNEKKLNLYDRANHFRRNNEFDKAEGIYEKILDEDPTDAESYWSLVLCRYGIEYVEDPATRKRVPTVNRAQYTSIYADENYKKALEYSDTLQKTIYEAEARAIDDIQKGILEISSKEEPFDVFICYKETDDQGRRTRDSVYATELYHALTDEGFKVFFSRITLEDKLGTAYEPYIFAALNSAKVMVVLGTKPEHFNAVWVKNEWSRYLSLISGGAKKTLIPAFRDMDPYDLPEEFSHLQSQDMSKLGFLQDLVRGIKKILGEDQPAPQAAAQPVVVQSAGGVNLTAQIKRGIQALEDGDWTAADGFFDKALDLDAECAEAFFGKALAAAECASGEELVEDRLSVRGTERQTFTACQKDTARIEKAAQAYTLPGYFSAEDVRGCFAFDEREYSSQTKAKTERLEEEKAWWEQDRMMSRAVRYATGGFADTLYAYRDKIIAELTEDYELSREKDAKEKERIAARYAERMEQAEQSAKKLYEEALKKREADYNRYCEAQEKADSEALYSVAAANFEREGMRGYKDSASRARQCREMQNRLKNEREEAAKQAELKEIEEETKQREEKARQRAEQERAEALAKQQAADARKKLLARLGIAIGAVAVAAIVIALVMTNVIIPKQKMNEAMNLLESGDYDSAYALLEDLGDNDAIVSSKRERASELLNEGKYEEAYALFEQLGDKDAITTNKHERAMELLDSGDYDSAYALLEENGDSETIASSKYERALRLLDSGDYDSAYALLEGIKDNEYIASTIYDKAIAYLDSGDYEIALKLLDGLNYKDSSRLISQVKQDESYIKSAQVGTTIRFGAYEQDNDTSNGKEDISWIILKKEGSRILVTSEYALDCQPYNSTYAAVTWETCTLRSWLNNDFLNTAFSEEQQRKIPTVTVKADANPEWDTNPGNDTQDQVFLLSIKEVNQFFPSSSAARCNCTAYAEDRGCYTDDYGTEKGRCWWWLRTPGSRPFDAAFVDEFGDSDNDYNDNDDAFTVRPALWIDLDS